MNTITLIKPNDFHLHLRDGSVLERTVSDSAKQFGKAIIMPNLVPPITQIEHAQHYRERILKCIPNNIDFEPLMTLYLTDDMQPELIHQAKLSKIIYAAKLYPAHATTHSQFGVSDIKNIHKVLEAMQEHHIPLLIHGEVVDANIDIFDREKVFIDRTLSSLIKQFPELKIVLEHISTKDAVDFILDTPDNVAATITPHHLMLNRNDLLVGGIKPHHYCLPIVKSMPHQQALIKAATSGNKKFFLGTDSAPHAKHLKENACGCAGIYSAFNAIEIYTEIFENENALDKLEAFASIYGAEFYDLPLNSESITLTREAWQVPNKLSFGEHEIVPLMAGQTLQWKLGIMC